MPCRHHRGSSGWNIYFLLALEVVRFPPLSWLELLEVDLDRRLSLPLRLRPLSRLRDLERDRSRRLGDLLRLLWREFDLRLLDLPLRFEDLLDLEE